jgi:hypothetical protein
LNLFSALLNRPSRFNGLELPLLHRVLFPRVLSVSDSAIRIPHLIWASFPIDDQYDSYELILSRMEKGD